MTINKVANGKDLIISLAGRLDTTTAPQLDDELIRLYSNDSGEQYFRADAMGLASGNYSFKVVPVEDGKEQSGAASDDHRSAAHCLEGACIYHGEDP